MNRVQTPAPFNTATARFEKTAPNAALEGRPDRQLLGHARASVRQVGRKPAVSWARVTKVSAAAGVAAPQPSNRAPSTDPVMEKSRVRGEEAVATPEPGSETLAHLHACRTRHYQAFARYNQKLPEQLSAAVAYSRLCQTTDIKNREDLEALVHKAQSLAQQAHLPDRGPGRNNYKAWQQDWNGHLRKDLLLLNRLVSHTEEAALADFCLQRGSIHLSDLLKVMHSDQYPLKNLKTLFSEGHTAETLATGLRNGLHVDHLEAVTPSEALGVKDMSEQQRSNRFRRLVEYRLALPSETTGTQFFLLARQAFEERMEPAEMPDFAYLIQSKQYSLEELKTLSREGHKVGILATGLRNGLHVRHLQALTPGKPLAVEDMSEQQRSNQFRRLVEYKLALPSETTGTQFFLLARQAFEEQMKPEQLAAVDGVGPTVLRLLKNGKSLDGLAERLKAYRAELPDMDRKVLAGIAGQALDCDLPAEHLKPMVLAGVPIHQQLKPDSELTQKFAKARRMETRTLAGGQSGSPVKLVTLTLADGTQQQLVTKQLNSCPLVAPSAHMGGGIVFHFDQLAQTVETAFAQETGKPMDAKQKQQAQASLTAAFHEALLKGSSTLEWRLNLEAWDSKQQVFKPWEKACTEAMPPLEQLPNLYGRDLAMRKLAAFLGQPGLVAPVKVAIVDGVYCEVSDYNPNLGSEVLTATGDAILKLDKKDLNRAVNSMSADDLNALGWSYGFDSVRWAEDHQSLRFQPKESDGALPGRVFMNRVDADDPAVRRRHADHHTKDFLANEQDNHSGNYSQGASWDHDASFGVKQNYGAQPPKVIRSSMLKALQDEGRWNTFKGELAGLISPDEIDALSERRTQLLQAHPQPVDDGGWGSDQVGDAMGLAVIKAARKTFDEAWKTAKDGEALKAAKKAAYSDWSFTERASDNRHAAPLAVHLFEWEDALISMEIKNQESQPEQPSMAVFDDYAIRQQILARAKQAKLGSGQV